MKLPEMKDFLQTIAVYRRAAWRACSGKRGTQPRERLSRQRKIAFDALVNLRRAKRDWATEEWLCVLKSIVNRSECGRQLRRTGLPDLRPCRPSPRAPRIGRTGVRGPRSGALTRWHIRCLRVRGPRGQAI